MNFTYDGYLRLLRMLPKYNYKVSSFDICDNEERCVILRHDIDYSLEKTIRVAEIENEIGVQSTFFLLLCTDFYNVFSEKGRNVIYKLQALGHEIGLHFDEHMYPDDFGKPDRILHHISREAEALAFATGYPITKVSMHRPSRAIIDADLDIPGMINTYGKKYMNEYKYVSDSRRKWREPIDDYIINGRYDRFQILIHPFWYNDREINLEESIHSFIRSASLERYDDLDRNITDLSGVVKRDLYV